ncbi:hypothetical protein SCUP515_00872 [Seiridium cupressi]
MSENTPPNNPRILETSDTRRRVNKESQPLMSSASQSPPQRPMVPAIRAPVERVVSEGSVRQKSKHEAPVQHAHDTFGAFASSQAGYKLEGIRDMSVTANTSSIVQIIVNNGAEPRQFPISRELLIAKAVKFGLGGDPADHKVEMAEVFEAHDTTVPKPPIDLAKMPRRGPVFSPTVELEFAGEPYKNSYQHICFMNRYKSPNQVPSFSGSAGFNPTNNGLLSNSSMSSSRTTLSPQTTSTIKRQRSPSQSTHLTKRVKTEVDGKSNYETVQMLLLSLAALTHKFRWPKCFNQAIENYRFGERSGSTLLARPAFAEKPRFMSDFIDRFDGTVIVPGCNVVRSGGNLQISTQLRMNQFRSTPLDNMHANNYRMDG